MLLSKETIEYLTRVIRVAKILKIESVIIDKESIRGQLQEEGSILLQKENLPNFEFQSIGITRINTLITRINLLGNDFDIDAEEKDKNNNEKVIYKLKLFNNKTEVEFKCADPALMPKTIKTLNDPVYYSFNINEESILLLSKIQSAVQGDALTFIGKKNDSGSSVVCKVNDVEGDMLNHIISEELALTPECDKNKFAFSYKNKVLIPLLKEALDDSEVTILITRRGLLTMQIKGIKIFISPEL